MTEDLTRSQINRYFGINHDLTLVGLEIEVLEVKEKLYLLKLESIIGEVQTTEFKTTCVNDTD